MTVYVTATVLKTTLGIGSSYADADIITAVEAASRACDGYKATRFWATTESRYYTGDPCRRSVDIDDVSVSATATVLVDLDGDGTYETTWTNGTDYYLGPINAASDGYPFSKLVLSQTAGKTFPRYDNAIKVTASFGWAAVPGGVTQATSILAGRLLKRSRETPYGILVVSGDAVAAARLGRIDPDVAFLLDNIPGAIPLLAI
jgi:hypothetical protein